MTMSNSTKTSSNSQISFRTSPSAHLVSTNDDLLTEILVCLPVRSLIRFKSVSKHWLYLITNPRFSRRRSKTVVSASGLFLHRSSLLINPEHDFVPLNHDQSQTKPPFKTLSFVNDPSGIHILQSCNGLLCCSTFIRGPTKKCNYYIYNPTTDQSTTLPDPTRRVFSADRGVELVLAVALAFDPSKSAHYKVVCVYFSETLPEHYEMEIYSSESGLWRPSGDPFAAEVNFRYGIFWNGAINWISTWGNTDSLYFDVKKEQLGVIPMPVYPETVEQDRMLTRAMESRGHLHLIEILHRPSTEFKIYEMEKDYSGWVLKYRVDLQTIIDTFPETICRYLDPTEKNYYRFSVLSMVREEKEEESFLVVHVPGKAVKYNLLDNTFKKICDFAPLSNHDDGGLLQFDSFGSFQFIESLCFA